MTYLEEPRTVRIEVRQNDLFSFLPAMHTAHSRRGPRILAARLWGYYNEFSTWAFLFMALSGVYLWLESRPGLRWTQLLTVTAVGGSVALWLTTG